MPSSLLTADWINSAYINTQRQADELIEGIFEGLISSGLFPFEAPMDEELAQRMTPEQLQTAIQQAVFEASPEAAPLRALEIAKSEYIRANPPT